MPLGGASIVIVRRGGDTTVGDATSLVSIRRYSSLVTNLIRAIINIRNPQFYSPDFIRNP
jgi:hypothetical protein